MKASTFQAPFEYRLELKGDSWSQGDHLEGHIQAKNRGAEKVNLNGLRASISYRNTKSGDEILVWETELDLSAEMEPGSQSDAELKLSLPETAPVKDSAGCVILKYGRAEQFGEIELPIQPHPAIQYLLDSLSVHHRFVVKYVKNKKGDVEIKFKPSDGKQYSNVDQLIILASVAEGTLSAKYIFTVTQITADETGIKSKKKKENFEQILTSDDYLLGGKFPNKEKLAQKVDEILSQVRSSGL